MSGYYICSCATARSCHLYIMAGNRPTWVCYIFLKRPLTKSRIDFRQRKKLPHTGLFWFKTCLCQFLFLKKIESFKKSLGV